MDETAEYSAFAQARWPALVRSAVLLGCDFEEARDLAQITLLRCFTSWRKVQNADDRDAYVFQILLNSFRDSRRRRWWGEKATPEVPHDVQATAPDHAHDIEMADAIHRALADLDLAHRSVVVLRYLANLSEQQTASVLGIKPGTVKSRLSRALSRMASNPHLSDTR